MAHLVLEATGVEFDWDVQEVSADVMDEYGTPLLEAVLDAIGSPTVVKQVFNLSYVVRVGSVRWSSSRG